MHIKLLLTQVMKEYLLSLKEQVERMEMKFDQYLSMKSM